MHNSCPMRTSFKRAKQSDSPNRLTTADLALLFVCKHSMQERVASGQFYGLFGSTAMGNDECIKVVSCAHVVNVPNSQIVSIASLQRIWHSYLFASTLCKKG